MVIEMEEVIEMEKSEVQGGVEPRTVQDDVSGQGLKERIRELYEKHKREIMKHVHRKSYTGQSETQIDFFVDEGKVLLHDHATPCVTYYDFKQPDFSFTVPWDPFFSYEQLDDIFEYNLEEFERYRKIEEEILKEVQ